MNILFNNIFFVGFMVSENLEYPYSGTVRIRILSPTIVINSVELMGKCCIYNIYLMNIKCVLHIII